MIGVPLQKLPLAEFLAWENAQAGIQKFALCRRLASLQEDVLVDPETPRVEALRRAPDNQWLFVDTSAEPTIRFASIEQSILLADAFDGIDPPA